MNTIIPPTGPDETDINSIDPDGVVEAFTYSFGTRPAGFTRVVEPEGYDPMLVQMETRETPVAGRKNFQADVNLEGVSSEARREVARSAGLTAEQIDFIGQVTDIRITSPHVKDSPAIVRFITEGATGEEAFDSQTKLTATASLFKYLSTMPTRIGGPKSEKTPDYEPGRNTERRSPVELAEKLGMDTSRKGMPYIK